jgi:hypothetical protein
MYIRADLGLLRFVPNKAWDLGGILRNGFPFS